MDILEKWEKEYTEERKRFENLEKWEEISMDTYRLKVFGGWLVRVNEEMSDSMATAMVFVPDPNYEWVIKKEDDKK